MEDRYSLQTSAQNLITSAPFFQGLPESIVETALTNL
ncbi:MAG: Crp/Fnr family transcriptional regulator, partial [Sphaerospermopsis kisseleviana]